jgi:membrane-bound lytic murein transglycosylase D
MNSINKYIKHLSLFFIVVGLVVSAGTVEVHQVSPGYKANTVDPDPQSDNLWDRLRASFHMDHATGQTRVQTHRAWFLNNPDYVENVFNRAEPYLHYIAQEIESRDLPMEFILIPFIESTYDPMARSHKGATGLWQLMAATARHYGIVQNGLYDGRRDIHESTSAALGHLSYLATLYDNDWHLVLAAYNMGQGALNRAISKNKAAGKGTDFWSLDNIPKETRDYVPKIIALADVVKNYERHNIDIPAVADEPQVAVVDIDVKDYLDLTIAANLADIETEELKEMNPGFTQTVMANQTHLLIPADKVEIFEAALADYTPVKKSTSQYIVQTGDTLNKIAKVHGVSVALLQQYNSLSSTTINVGQKLRIPRGA